MSGLGATFFIVRTHRPTLLTLLILLVAGCAAAPTSRPPVTVTVTQTAEPEKVRPTPSPEAAVPAPVETTPVAEPAQAPAEVETLTMPDLVGQNLQLAQDILQDLGSYVLDQEDASGLDRFQVNDSNWKVCMQDPAPGSIVNLDAIVTLGSVKIEEACP